MCKGRYVAPIVFIITCILTYGGVSGFVVFFVIYPIALNLFKEANLEQVHRIAAIAAGTLDTLPHQGAQITLLGICKMTHKEAYFDIMVTQIVIPFIACFLFILICSLGL